MSFDPARLCDPFWRWSNLYRIITDDSREIAFVPNAEQVQLYKALWYRNLVLKARQLGFTTGIDLMFLDQCLWRSNVAAAIIADTRESASKIFRNKVLYPYEQLPEALRCGRGIRKRTETEIVFDNNSSISVTTSARGGTINFLHVSEAGKIARRFPDKMTEIATGSFEAVPSHGMIVVESTAEGREGWYYKACTEAERRQLERRRLSPLEFRLHFFPWWRKAAYRADPSIAPISEELRTYFRELNDKHGIALDAEQQAWYAFKKQTLGELMGREHPSYPAEAFARAIDGVIYAEQMRALRRNGRIGRIALRPEMPVNTFWDFGLRDTNAIWCHQHYGTEHRFVKCIGGAGKGLAHWWAELEMWRIAHGLRWGRHFLPHDADKRIEGRDGADIYTRRDILVGLGMRDDMIVVVPRVADIDTGIQVTRQAFADYAFDTEGCNQGIEALDAYQYEWDEENGAWSRFPRHNWASHWADALRQHAQGYRREDEMAGRPTREAPPAAYLNGGY